MASSVRNTHDLRDTGDTQAKFDPPAGSGARVPILLRLIAVTVFVIPANMVIEPIGAVGYVTMLLAIMLFVFWLASILLGLHDPIPFRHPGRVGLSALWIATCFSYLWMTHQTTSDLGRASADRWLLSLLGITAIALVTTECLRTIVDALILVRSLVLGASLCAIIALYQFATKSDPVDIIRAMMVGFVDNGGNTTFQVRSSFVRVAGTTFSPIELGVVSSMILPLAIWAALFDRQLRRWWRWAQAALIFVAAVSTVSRSAIISLLIVAVVLVPFLPTVARKWALMVVPAAILFLFVTIPGLVATLTGSFTAGSDDPSLTTRLNNFPRVEARIIDHPFLGTGPGTYMPTNALEIVDNQYFHTAMEMGLLGLAALMLFLITPAIAALTSARHAVDPAVRLLAGSVATAGFIAAVSSATFDSFSFPVFTCLFPFVAGLSGAVWRMTCTQNSSKASPGRHYSSAERLET